MPKALASPPWYGKGLRFACVKCGHCCTGEPGSVWVTDDEVHSLARVLELSPPEFRAMYTRKIDDGGTSLREKNNDDCIMYDSGAGCRVYHARPRQCRTWPFWPRVISSPESWNDEAGHCPGMNQGPVHTSEKIHQQARSSPQFGERPFR